MKKVMILSSISLLAALMTTSVWAETPESSTTDAAPKTEVPVAAPEEKTTTEAPVSAPEEKTTTEAPVAATGDANNATTDTATKKEDSATEDTAASTAEKPTAELYIISPKEGDEVSSPVTVVFGLKGMGVAPAGVEKDNTGHHHLLIDQTELPAEGVPMGADVKHFGGGQTQAEVELTAGEHTLQLILGDMAHIPLSPVLSSEKITIKVK